MLFFFILSHTQWWLSDPEPVSIAFAHPTVSITFIFLIICARFHLLSFIYFSLSYRFPCNCYNSQQHKPHCYSVTSDMTLPLSPTFVSKSQEHTHAHARIKKNVYIKKKNTLQECVYIVRSTETILNKKILNKIPSFQNAYYVLYLVLGVFQFRSKGCEKCWQNVKRQRLRKKKNSTVCVRLSVGRLLCNSLV